MAGVAPDSSTDAPPPDPSQAPSAMETDDNNEAVPASSATTHTAQAASATQVQQHQQAATNFTASLSGAVPDAGGDVDALRKRLEAKELEITGELSVAEYAHLLLIYLVQFKHAEAKYCYMRAFAKHKTDLLKELWKIGAAVAKFDYGRALQQCHQLKLDAAVQTYITELANRMTSLQIEIVSKCYTSLERDMLAELLGLSPDSEDLARLITACGWTVDAGWVLPVETDQSRAVATQLVNPAFGEFNRPKKEEQAASSGVDIEALKKLVAANDFFDMHIPAQASK